MVVPDEPGLEIFAELRLTGARAAAAGTGARIEPLPLVYEEERAAGLAARWRGLGLDAIFAYNGESRCS